MSDILDRVRAVNPDPGGPLENRTLFDAIVLVAIVVLAADGIHVCPRPRSTEPCHARGREVRAGKILDRRKLPARGELRFTDCAACHAPQPGVANVGPSLTGVFGRKAGTLADFRYSPALKRSGITWTPETLDIFLADPQKAVPNNRMPYAGMPDAADRADLIAFLLKTAK